jgi:hypothetical protein
MKDQTVDNIINGIAGDIRIGQKYYIFTVTYAYIGRVEKLGDRGLTLASDCLIVNRAGSDDDAVSKIVSNKKKPESCETPGKNICVFYQAITALIPM